MWVGERSLKQGREPKSFEVSLYVPYLYGYVTGNIDTFCARVDLESTSHLYQRLYIIVYF